MNMNKLEKKLIELYGKIETFEKIRKHNGGEFNVFSILKMERLEVKTHSAFIYELINPQGNHYQENKYLELFIKYVLELELDLKSIKVKQEDLTNENRRVDFTIEDKENFIVIEMKIDANDQDSQLYDYKKFADSKNKTTHVYYLTLDGKEASEKSSKGINYKKISFSYHILEWIEKGIEKSSSLPVIRENLNQYKQLIEKITNQNDEEIEMEVIKMIDTPELAKSATVLSQNIGDIWAEKESYFWQRLKDLVSNEIIERSTLYNGYDEIKENIKKLIKEQRPNKDAEFGLKLILKKGYEEITCYIYQHNTSRLMIQVGSYEKKSKFIDSISEELLLTKKYGEAKYKELNNQVNFYGKNNPEELTYEIFDSKQFKKIILDVSNEINNYLEKIQKSII